MPRKRLWNVFAVLLLSCLATGAGLVPAALAQGTAPAADTNQAKAPEPLSEDELEVLVARIALYPDELVALISSASLFPLQIVEAARFLDRYAKDKTLKPKQSWDGSVISLLNYPQIVEMMSDDLEWTQAFGDALTFQQKDVLVAIQQLREEAVAKGVIKSDDKIKVTHEQDNVIIQSASTEHIYIPRYEPEMFYEPGYAMAPVTYYSDSYPSYYYPGATFFAAAVTGAVFAAAVDWNDWGVWGGRWNGDVDVNCNRCLNNVDIDRKMNLNDIDWRNVDRDKISIDRDQFAKFDRTNIRNDIKADRSNSFKERAASVNRDRPATQPGRASQASDIRKNAIEGLKTPGAVAARPNVARPDAARPRAGSDVRRPDTPRPAASRPDTPRPAASRPNVNRPQASRPSGPPRAGARVDHRPAHPSGLGNVQAGRVSQIQSHRGAQAMGGGHRGGGAPRAMPHGGGGGRRR
ncbi:DUF3300 domain-containing protein [Aquabacter sp. CN5-332]|uniref:DUF3300 domain-containing protein n=1 Tax=Aquabacter sp. CN5-332 TaxID=3156608 RepID=UPI0032B5465B